MQDFIVRMTVYLTCFALSLYALSSVNYEKILRKGKVWQAQILYILLAMALATLAAQFLMGIAYKPIL